MGTNCHVVSRLGDNTEPSQDAAPRNTVEATPCQELSHLGSHIVVAQWHKSELKNILDY
jgi:hypothetical protein